MHTIIYWLEESFGGLPLRLLTLGPHRRGPARLFGGLAAGILQQSGLLLDGLPALWPRSRLSASPDVGPLPDLRRRLPGHRAGALGIYLLGQVHARHLVP